MAKIVGAAGIDLKPEQDFTWIERAAAYTLRDEIYAENLQQYQSAVDNTPRPSPSILDRPKYSINAVRPTSSSVILRGPPLI